MTVSSELENTIAPAISALGFELVNCAIVSEGHRKTLRVFVDNPEGGVTVDDCMRISQQISAVLDVSTLILGQYNLEVSSPGLDRLLITKAHYQRFLGRRVRIKLRNALDGRRNFSGELQGVFDTTVRIHSEDGTFDLELENIEKANLIPELRF
ncbi:MAG TPA: ribosome maturation factor RimP [Gammaproteobacteria bacterium]|nr:ribosome maturation factor RimP [Gammaproteobacteria bacterium]